jgi:DNA-binding NarL/FixJ family response regulator
MDSIRKRLDALSGRERDVLKGLAAGKANKVIAYDLGISARTVEVYRANVMTKMQADSPFGTGAHGPHVRRRILVFELDQRGFRRGGRRWCMSKPPDVILLVDDDAAVRNALKFSLEMEGFSVRLYATPEALLAEEHLPTADASSSTTGCPRSTGSSSWSGCGSAV